MEIGNRVIYDETGRIYAQLGEVQGDVRPRSPIEQLQYVDLPYGAIDHENEVLISIDPETKHPVIRRVVHPLTPEQLRIAELEDQLLLAAEKETGGIL